MPASRRLKVFRTSIGFHDAYVAAPSRKAALAAWGASTDLFAIGSAELVTDPKLIQAALDRPGEVIRQSRGSAAQHLAAADRTGKSIPRPAKQEASASLPAGTKSRPSRPARPRPDRKKLDQAEAALADFERAATVERETLRRREEDLAREKAKLEARLERAGDRLRNQIKELRSRHEQALTRWRETS